MTRRPRAGERIPRATERAPRATERAPRAGERAARAGATAAARWPAWVAPAAIAALVLAMGADVFQLGFFADDYHFLDVARRVPLLEALSGRHGIYPWYRPLSRELFFAGLAAAGPVRAAVAHAAGLIALAGSAWLVYRIGRALVSARAGAIGAILFATYGFSKFLAAWASGFQDMLALLLTLLALDATIAKRRGWSLVWAGLAPLAKETGFVAVPLVLLHAILCERERRVRPWMLAQVGASAAMVALHLAVRATWHSAGSTSTIEHSAKALASALVHIAGGFVGPVPAGPASAAVVAAIAAVAAAVLMRGARGDEGATTARAARGSGVAFLGIAALAGLAPLVVGQVVGLTSAYAYYGFPAAPWLALLLGAGVARLPRVAGEALAIGLAGWNVWALGLAPPDLAPGSDWVHRRWDWPEAVRLSAVSRRLEADLRATITDRPESLVVLFRELPMGCYFQTEDGPATREALADPTARSYFVNDVPYRVDARRLVMVVFDVTTCHFERDHLSFADRSTLAASAVAMDYPARAWMFTSLGDSVERASIESRYFRAATALVGEGVSGYLRELGASGLLDSVGGAERTVAAIPLPPGLRDAMTRVLRQPLDAGPHATFAESLARRGIAVTAAVELRIAVTLDPGRFDTRLRLAELLTRLGERESARVVLEKLSREAGDAPAGREARRRMAGRKITSRVRG